MNTSIRKTSIAVLAFVSAILLSMGLFFANQQKVYATDEDKVTITDLTIDWDQNGGSHDFVTLYLKGADYTTVNENWIKDFEWIRPFVYVNGVQVSVGDVAWVHTGAGGTKDRCRFFLKKDILKQDGTDEIEIKKGCKFPKTGGEDYYILSEDTKFFSKGQPGIAGKVEHFYKSYEWIPGVELDVTDNVLKSQPSETLGGRQSQSLKVAFRDTWGLTAWAGNTGNMVEGQFIRIEFTRPIDVATIKTLDVNYLYNDPKTVFDFYRLDSTKLDNSELVYTHLSTGKGAKQHVKLRTADFAVDGKMNGFIIALNENARATQDVECSQFFIDSVTPLEEELPAKFVYTAGTVYDADDKQFFTLPVKNLGTFTSQVLSIGDLGSYGWGITDFATFSGHGMELNQFAEFQFINPIDVKAFKSIEITFMHNDNNAKFYVYPISTKELKVENAVQCFRTPAGAGKKVTFSTEKLAEQGLMRGFIIHLVEKNGVAQQFFLDSFKLSEECYDTSVNVTFSDGVASKKVAFNSAVERPEDPVKEADAQYTYTFDDWYVGEEKFDFNTKLTEDITLTAKYTTTINKYNVTFKAENGEQIGDIQSVEYGKTCVAPEDPSKQGDAQYTYTFDGWYMGEEKFDVSTAITGDMILQAKFIQSVNKYNVTLKDDNDEVIKEIKVEYGKTCELPEDPVKENTAQYSYTFDGWYIGEEKFDFNTEIKEDIVLKAVYLEEVNMYTVTYSDGIEAQVVAYGTILTAPETPLRENTAQYTYTFDGWYMGEEKFDFTTPVTKDMQLDAKFTETINKYTVSFGDSAKDQQVEYNKVAEKPADPVKEGYTFDGWYLGEQKFDFNTPVTRDLQLHARFTENPVEAEGGCSSTIHGDILPAVILMAIACAIIPMIRRKATK